ncbi:MAG: hypothetical protein ACYC0Z_16845 [Acidobacteriaceae bacterium]|jgi:hypothetical protein
MNTIEDFIKTVILSDVDTMVKTKGLQYLSFGVMASMIEFLGACLDKKDFFDRGLSGKRFSRAIYELEAFKKYRIYTSDRRSKKIKNVKCDLYRNLRNGMVHIVKPGKEVAFTERKDPDDGNKHLMVCNFNDGTERLVIVCEDFYSDISEAANELLKKMKLANFPRRNTDLFMNPRLKTVGSKKETTSVPTVSGSASTVSV